MTAFTHWALNLRDFDLIPLLSKSADGEHASQVLLACCLIFRNVSSSALSDCALSCLAGALEREDYKKGVEDVSDEVADERIEHVHGEVFNPYVVSASAGVIEAINDAGNDAVHTGELVMQISESLSMSSLSLPLQACCS
jgi:hypothetical protein